MLIPVPTVTIAPVAIPAKAPAVIAVVIAPATTVPISKAC
jgi:hypothetical protein